MRGGAGGRLGEGVRDRPRYIITREVISDPASLWGSRRTRFAYNLHDSLRCFSVHGIEWYHDSLFMLSCLTCTQNMSLSWRIDSELGVLLLCKDVCALSTIPVRIQTKL